MLSLRWRGCLQCISPDGGLLLAFAGGIESVTLGDEEARRRGVQKSILERAGPPTFDVAVRALLPLHLLSQPAVAWGAPWGVVNIFSLMWHAKASRFVLLSCSSSQTTCTGSQKLAVCKYSICLLDSPNFPSSLFPLMKLSLVSMPFRLFLWIHEQNGLDVDHQVEMVDRTHWRVHRDVGAAVDRLLLNQAAGDETRTFDAGGSVVVVADAEDGRAVSSMAVAERCLGSFVLSIPIAQHAQSHGISLQL